MILRYVFIGFFLFAAQVGCATNESMHDKPVLPVPEAVFFEGVLAKTGPYTVDEIERVEMQEIQEHESVPQVPFGFLNEQWQQFKEEHVEAGDELYNFLSAEDGSSVSLYFAAMGVAVVRRGMVVAVFRTGAF